MKPASLFFPVNENTIEFVIFGVLLGMSIEGKRNYSNKNLFLLIEFFLYFEYDTYSGN